MVVFFVLSFFPRGVLDGILDLIESVSEGFPTYYLTINFSHSFLAISLKLDTEVAGMLEICT